MTFQNHFLDIQELISPVSEQKSTLQEVLKTKAQNIDSVALSELQHIDATLDAKFDTIKTNDSPWVKFIRILLDKLYAINRGSEKEELISVTQQKILKSSVEMIVCIAILPSLKNGIGIPMKQRLPEKSYTFLEELHKEEKCYLLNLSVIGFMGLFEAELFRPILTSKHLGDLIAANVQLIMDREAAVDCKLYSNYLKTLIENTYQPFVIRELMVMLGNKAVSKNLSHCLSKILTARLTAEGGLLATLHAILDLTGDSKDNPKYWNHISVLSKLLISPKHSSVYPQLLELLKGQDNQYRQVAVMSLKLLFEERPEDCMRHFIKPLLLPFVNPSTEKEIGTSLEAIHACCGISAPWSVPANAFKSGATNLLRLFVKTRSSVSYLKSKSADIAQSIISDEQVNLREVFEESLFGKLNITFHLGAEGGVYSNKCIDEVDSEEVADALLELILSGNNFPAKIRIFQLMIDLLIQNQDLERQLIYTKLLSEICNESDIQKYLGDNPSCIIPFINTLLKEPNKFGDEIVCLGLMVLGVMIDAPFTHKPVDWAIFKVLTEPLKNFKSSSSEANVLANELYELILSHGVARSRQKKAEKITTNLDKALEEAVDPLLPVRAHGLKQLGKLILAKDKQTLEKIETILFMFQENLKDEDSFVYLAAVEGLGALASSFPDEVLMTLIDEYISTKHSTEDRLKVGEVLLKLGRLLNEMAVVYKNELISCFLVGCRDEDNLMRASSLSNLGELCKLMSFRISPFLVEILECIKAIYETDKHPEPRRAAVMVLTLLLKGLGEQALNTLEPVLLDIYRGLKRIYESDKDDLTRLHAQLALEELRASTITFMFPVKPLEKRIFVLDPPT